VVFRGGMPGWWKGVANMPRTERMRLDYMPCPAAVAALQAAQDLYPEASAQTLIDRLVITGLCALAHDHWQPPRLHGKRDAWKFPPCLQVPGESR
jgi:hypothetical protein